MKIHVEIFEVPSGSVRGFATLTFGLKKKVIGHATFLTDGPPTIAFKTPSGKLSVEQVLDLGKAYQEFALELAKHA